MDYPEMCKSQSMTNQETKIQIVDKVKLLEPRASIGFAPLPG
jgi:hypothetical protein